MNDDSLLKDSIFKIGKVISVDGRMIKVKVDKSKNSSSLLYKGELLKNISVGGYVKITKGFTKIIGKVDGEFVTEDKEFAEKSYKNDGDKINRTLNISLLGFFEGQEFERGIKELPLIDNECYLLEKNEFDQVHNFIKGEDEPIYIGVLSLEKGQRIGIGINSLFASHIGIFGNTGSGKSYTLAKIYYELFGKYKDNSGFKKKANFFLVDFNGEYDHPNAIVEEKYKNIYKLSTRLGQDSKKFPVSEETLNDPIFWAIYLEATEKTQTPFLRSVMTSRALKRIFEGGDFNASLRIKLFSMVKETIDKKDKNLGSKIFVELFSDLYTSVNNPEKLEDAKSILSEKLGFNGTTGSYMNIGAADQYSQEGINNDILVPLKAKIEELEFNHSSINIIRLKVVVKYYDDIIKGHANREHLSPLIKRMDSRYPELEKVIEVTKNQTQTPDDQKRNITIVSFKDVEDIHIRKILPLLLCKSLYNEKKKNHDNTFLNIIIDEAHNILSENSERESEQWKDYRLETFEEIIKEGRKFGVFLTIASQRPSDISQTIISQLHNYFLHRLINQEDIKAVEKTISFLDKVSFDYIPILPTGTCILAGLLAQIPVVVDIGEIEKKFVPKNETMTLIDKWK
jgi:DNA helicase HerA-like ATPase